MNGAAPGKWMVLATLVAVGLVPTSAWAAGQATEEAWTGWGIGFVMVFVVGTLFLATCFMLAYNYGRRRRSRHRS